MNPRKESVFFKRGPVPAAVALGRWRPAIALLCKSAGVLLLIAAFILFRFHRLYSWDGDAGIKIALIFGAAFVAGAGSFLFRAGKRLKAASAAVTMAADGRPPVLYLRSFVDDAGLARSDLDAAFAAQIGGSLPLPSREEQIAEAFSAVGPVIAIGKPGEKLPELGAARLYVSDAEWQNNVVDLMRRARLIVLRAGFTPSFWWEVQTSVQLAPEKVLFLVELSRQQYAAFREKAKQFLPRDLPELGDKVGFGVLYFDQDWTPHLVPYTYSLVSSFTGNYTKPLVTVLRQACRPVFKRLGIEVPVPRWRPSAGFLWTVAIIVSLGFGLLIMLTMR